MLHRDSEWGYSCSLILCLCLLSKVLVELWEKVVHECRVEHFFDLVDLPSLIEPYKNSLLVVIRPKRCVRFCGGIESGLVVSWVVNGIMNCKLSILKSEFIYISRYRSPLVYLKVRQG